AFLAQRRSDATAELATELLSRISERLPILPMALVCEALAQGKTDIAAISDHLDHRGEALRAQGYPVHRMARDPRESVLIALRMLQSRKVLDLNADRVLPTLDGQKLFAFYARTLPQIPAQETENFTEEKLEV
ncbi:MAG: hypothetical protein AAGF30_09175, partial [Pseudomonadota bacterium]